MYQQITFFILIIHFIQHWVKKIKALIIAFQRLSCGETAEKLLFFHTTKRNGCKSGCILSDLLRYLFICSSWMADNSTSNKTLNYYLTYSVVRSHISKTVGLEQGAQRSPSQSVAQCSVGGSNISVVHHKKQKNTCTR